MVLEISATPFIFTFKLWDWGRLGLDGKPRPIHLEHGLANIQWERRADWVDRELVNHVQVVREEPGHVEEITGLRFRNKRASAFGSYGWTGGAVDRIQTRLMDAGFDISISLKAKWRLDGSALAECREHGRQLARQWALHPLDAPRPITTTQTTVTPVPAMPAVEPQAAAAAAEVAGSSRTPPLPQLSTQRHRPPASI